MLNDGECAYSQAEKHLSAYCFPNEVAKETIKIDKRLKVREVSDGSASASLKEAIKMIINSRPELLKFQEPSIWNRKLEFDHFACATMHLLFLGIVKSLFKDFLQWAKAHKQSINYLKSVEAKFDKLHNLEFCINWLCIEPLQSGKRAAWVSENCVA